MTLPLSHIDRWSDFGRKVLTPPPNFTAKLRPGSIAAIERIIGHKFNRPHLLAQAMVGRNADVQDGSHRPFFDRPTHPFRDTRSLRMNALNSSEMLFLISVRLQPLSQIL
jgi:hypothetical protein